ncbi:MAG: beta-ketoacyl synthase N-terminal-like domain-containing protein, partial [Gammaproteobacteria bacterium]
EGAWRAWERDKAGFLGQSRYRAKARLAEQTLAALPEILAGTRLATDVMFPNASMELVEGVYRNNEQADFYNAVVAGVVGRRVEEAIRANPNRPVRLLEVGAGTGGTTGAVLERLAGLAANIGEYAYTDLSKAFLRHAEKTFGARYPFVRGRLFDVEAAPQAQGLDAGSYDIVLATNVLHATRNLRGALRNAKATLAPGGLLVISEMTAKSVFAHVSFGLLEGWWLHEDAALRISGCPALSPEMWRTVLAQEGLRALALPADASAFPGQQVFAAQSDGLQRRRRAQAVQAAAPAPAADRVPAPDHASTTLDTALKEVLRTQVSTCLDIPRDEVAERLSFADYGLDSITAGQLVQAINVALGTRLKTIDVFEHSSVKRLAEYLLKEQRAACAAALAAPTPVAVKEAPAAPSEVKGSEAPAAGRVRALVKQQLCACLCVGAEEVGRHGAFADYGLDSITAGQFTQMLNVALGISLKPTALFQHSSIEQLTQHILERYPEAAGHPGAATPPAPAAPQPAAPVVKDDAIAIIGASATFARSSDLDALWEHLAAGADLVGPVTRWDLARHGGAQGAVCKHGSFLDDIDKFDPAFFNISGLEATAMDPQQRIFLEQCWKALEDAGHAGAAMSGQNCGVYVGSGAPDYRQLFGDQAPPQAMWGNVTSIVPARIAYYLDLQGPAIAVDTACSSSLVAVHLACQALLSGEVDQALAGGVSIQCTPDLYTTAGRAEMLSASGRCHTFDERADGFVPGEGAAVVVLKRLADALAAGDHIHALIRASGMNQDGASNGITAPNAKAQERLECAVYDKGGIDPAKIQMVEAHGTGTKLGDPIEFEALTRSFRKYTQDRQFCALGSIKSNLGHPPAAAGVAGLM